MKKLCIASVYGPTDKNNLWIKLQKKFIKKNTQDYEHIVFLDRIEDHKLFDGFKIIGSTNTPRGSRNHTRSNHITGLNAFLKYFNENQYENYAILDSDCFPCKENWDVKLSGMINKNKCHFASILRSEMGEQYPHPSAVFIPKKHLDISRFDFNKGGKVVNFVRRGYDKDLGTKVNIHHEGKNVWLPLIRTNTYNPHHVVAGIYGDMFYHHAAGSHNSIMKGRSYWKQIFSKIKTKTVMANQPNSLEILLKKLEHNPNKFISQLRGVYNS